MDTVHSAELDLSPGVTIHGSVPKKAKRFEISFQTGAKNGTIGFHMSVRFDEQVIVRNSNVNGWGREERGGGMPLSLGNEFNFVVKFCRVGNSKFYRVVVNGVEFCKFQERPGVNMDDIKHLVISGDAEIVYVA